MPQDPSTVAKLRAEMKESAHSRHESEMKATELRGQLAAEQNIRAALVNEAIATAKESMRKEVEEAFKAGMATAKQFYLDARALFK